MCYSTGGIGSGAIVKIVDSGLACEVVVPLVKEVTLLLFMKPDNRD
jgi:hypothetical protein